MRSRREGIGRRFITGALALLLAMGIAACSGPGGVNDSIGRAAPPGTELPVVAGAVATAPTPDRTSDATAFCRDVQQLQALVPTLLQPGGAPVVLAQAKVLVASLRKDAPAEIRPAVQELARIESRLITDLGANPPNLGDVAQVFIDPTYQRLFQQVEAFAATQC